MTGDPANETAPDTVTDAVRLLDSLGFDSTVTIADRAVHCSSCGSVYSPDDIVVHHTVRFEGPSDPGDEAIVLGVELPSCGAKGVIVSAYGPDADPELLDVVTALTR
jgi:hypothetical protein